MSKYDVLVLGVGKALSSTFFKSNYLIRKRFETHGLLIDCGTGIEYALSAQGLSHANVHAAFISHQHADHVGGLEWLAYSTRFVKPYESLGRTGCATQSKPVLYLPEDMQFTLWKETLRGGLGHFVDGFTDIESFFDVEELLPNTHFTWNGLELWCVPVPHVVHKRTRAVLMYSHALYAKTDTGLTCFTTDVCDMRALQYAYRNADLIFHDCHMGKPTPLHVDYKRLRNQSDAVRAKTWLTHYAYDEHDRLPNVVGDGFKGLLQQGQMVQLA